MSSGTSFSAFWGRVESMMGTNAPVYVKLTQPRREAHMASQKGEVTGTVTNKKGDKVVVADVVRTGERIVVPDSLPLDEAIKILQRQQADEEQIVRFTETVKCFPWEGAIAFRKAIEEQFGYFRSESTQTFFGPIPPQEITIETGVDSKTTAPWGKIHFAFADKQADEWLYTNAEMVDGRICFQIVANVKKKWKATMMRLAQRTREIVEAESIYRGKPLRIAFTDDDGSQITIPKPSFMDVGGINLGEMVYTKELEELMEYNIFTPLRHSDQCRRAGIPLKRGALLAGQYGTGKSLFARGVAKVAIENGWTYLYIRNAAELPHAIRFAQLYQPCVIFAEDVDRAITGERTEEMDEVLNTLDGIDSKSNDIMVILTTNHLENVNRAMLRPGRLDVILHIVPPDAEAAARLVRVYGRNVLAADTNLDDAAALLKGQTPAVIREVVERAKLASIGRTGSADTLVSGEDIYIAARTMQQQQELLAPKPVEVQQPGAVFMDGLAARVHEKLAQNGLAKLPAMQQQVEALHEHLI